MSGHGLQLPSAPASLPLLPRLSVTEPGTHRDGSNRCASPTVNRGAETEAVHRGRALGGLQLQ